MIRRVPILPALLVLASCATPPIRLTPAFPPGQQRTYEIDAGATTITRTAAGTRTERTHLVARSIVDLLASVEKGTRARIEVVPSSLTRDGRRVETPRAQVAEVVIGHNGGVTVLSVDGVPGSLLLAGAADLADVFGPPLPGRALSPGERFSSEGISGRVAALRVEAGYPSAIVRLGTRRTVERTRSEDGRGVTLRGTEVADTEMAFALREGFPVRISTTAEAPLTLLSDGRESGSILVRTVTTLTLIEPRVRGR